MTREDAIDIIQSILNKYEEDECLVTEITIGDEDIKAFKMAIKALEQEPRKDGIILTHKEYNELIANEYNAGYHKGYDNGYCKGCVVASEEQEPILEKINKMKSEIADSLEFWDYSPNNNPLARDMLETITNFWGDMRGEEE